MMAAMLDVNTTLTFQNTGREHPKTFEFLDRLQDGLGREIIWLEWRPPERKGAPPREFRFERVDIRTAARKGEPFRALLEALRDFRWTKGLEPITPWAKARLCTGYLKHKVKEKFVKSLGLRKDEPSRVLGLQARDTQREQFRCPLYDAGITKQDVLAFWRAQPFDLELREEQGNCTGCFLKDQGDLSRVLGEEETGAQWWFDIARDFPDFGGRNFIGYEALAKERPVRLAIESTLREGGVPASDGTLPARRFRFVLSQEKRRLAGERETFSCACEQSVALASEGTCLACDSPGEVGAECALCGAEVA